jgi:hypothetical protein
VCIISTAQQASPKVIGQRDPDCAQPIKRSSVATTNPFSASSPVAWRRRASCSGPGGTEPEARAIDSQEYEHRPEPEDADFAERDRPRKQERDLEVEDNEQDRDQVEAHVELAAGVVERVESALVGRFLGAVRTLARDHIACPDRGRAHRRGDREEN